MSTMRRPLGTGPRQAASESGEESRLRRLPAERLGGTAAPESAPGRQAERDDGARRRLGQGGAARQRNEG
ncbi:hypothetical protein [Streptomyces sp. NPDC059783]|uniref:hypothetical protein n=1 Tax=Streptomyces sp. NPDC059783 TaxID=3346944 RepID=UPI003661AD4B